MKIGPTNNSELFPGKVQKNQIEVSKREILESNKDTVEISQLGREKLKSLADKFQKEIGNDNEIIEQIAPKLARIRNKVESGYYDLDNIQSKLNEKIADTIIKEIDNNKNTE